MRYSPLDQENNFINVLSGIVKPMSGLIKVGNATFFDLKIKLIYQWKVMHWICISRWASFSSYVMKKLDFGYKRSNDETSCKQEIIELLGSGSFYKENPVIWR